MKKKLISLTTTLLMILIVLMVVGIAVNWNLFVVLALFMPIALVGYLVIILPSKLKKLHADLEAKVEKKIDEGINKIHEATK